MGVAAGDARQSGRAFVGEAVQDLGPVQHVPVAFLLLRCALEAGIACVIGREAFRRKELGFVENCYGRIYGADQLYMLGFEGYSDGDGKFISRHSVHHTEWRLGY